MICVFRKHKSIEHVHQAKLGMVKGKPSTMFQILRENCAAVRARLGAEPPAKKSKQPAAGEFF